MSLEVDGVWKAGVWAPTVWADGVWREGPPAESTIALRTISIVDDVALPIIVQDEQIVSII